ncbi:MAG: hypothetical protein GWO07_13900 [Candidatus Dadabacteria bacterium]|nr:hypothetical protein [Candidatus Dadabacteria bacterium]
MIESARGSWEHRLLPSWERCDLQSESNIEYTYNLEDKQFFRSDIPAMDIYKAVHNKEPLTKASSTRDTYTLQLEDTS